MPHSDVMNMEEIDYTVCEGWYDNDLQLAAELGKTLLERNKELEEHLVETQQQNQDQALQIVYLEKQLQVLRDVTETKAKIYEDLDMTSQRLEKTNDSLNHELRTAQQRIESLTGTIENLESKIVDQQEEIENLRKAEKSRLVEGRKQKRILENLINFSQSGFQLRRAQSFDLGKSTLESIYEEEMLVLQMNLRNTRNLLASKEKREVEMESEIAVLLREKAGLEKGLRELSVKAKMEAIKQANLSLAGKNFQVCHFCDRVIHEESEEGEPDLVPKLLSSSSPSGEPEEKEISILSEIDSQYKALMEKYNTLLEHSRAPDSNRQRTGSLRRKTDGPATPTQSERSAGNPPITAADAQKEGRAQPVKLNFEHSPPEYRKIFEEIFDILKKVKQPCTKTDESATEGKDTETL